MKRFLLSTVLVILVASGVFLLATAFSNREPEPELDIRIAEAHDPKLREILREQQHQHEVDELESRVEYTSIAAVEFAAAAFLAGQLKKRS